jgi:hypothetical protein
MMEDNHAFDANQTEQGETTQGTELQDQGSDLVQLHPSGVGEGFGLEQGGW